MRPREIRETTRKRIGKLAAMRGGRCLSIRKLQRRLQVKLQCRVGHTWWSRADVFLSGAWCRKCEIEQKASQILKRMQTLARRRGGKLQSTRFKNYRYKLSWQCKNGHTWKTRPDVITGGSWCRKCANKASRSSLERFQLLAKRRGGKCLSETYVNMQRRLRFQCEAGHVWMAFPENIAHGAWCQKCSAIWRGLHARTYSIDDIERLAIKQGGKCVSRKYQGHKVRLIFECRVGHRWKATPDNLIQGKWCSRCAHVRRGYSQRIGLPLMQKLAKKRGGDCLSTDYISNKAPLKWKCAVGHEWEAPPDRIKNRSAWCPHCPVGLGERICRLYFEGLFRSKFPRARPSWLRGPSGKLLELDGYSKDLKLAFEHQGPHHYRRVRFYGGKAASLSATQVRDRLKSRLCRQYGIRLIVVPELFTRLPINELLQFLEKSCQRLGVPLSVRINRIHINLKSAFSHPHYARVQTLAGRRGVQLISPIFRGVAHRHVWKCPKGHIRRAPLFSIEKHGCGLCYNERRTSRAVDRVRAWARKYGHLCLSHNWRGMYAKMSFMCRRGHRWSVAPKCICMSNRGCFWCAIADRPKRSAAA